MSLLTTFAACAVAITLHTPALEQRSTRWVLMFALACAGSFLHRPAR